MQAEIVFVDIISVNYISCNAHQAKLHRTYLEPSRKLNARQRRTISHAHIREQLRIASHIGIALEHLITVVHHSSITHRRDITEDQAQQSVHAVPLVRLFSRLEDSSISPASKTGRAP